MFVSSLQTIVVVPVHFELTIGILMVVLIRVPPERQHRVTNLGDYIVAAHQCGLVVAGFLFLIQGIGQTVTRGIREKELALNAGLHAVTFLGQQANLALQRDAGRGCYRFAVHP